MPRVGAFSVLAVDDPPHALNARARRDRVLRPAKRLRLKLVDQDELAKTLELKLTSSGARGCARLPQLCRRSERRPSRRTPGSLRVNGLLSDGRYGCLRRLLRLLSRFLGVCLLRRRFLCHGCLRLLSFGLFQCPTFLRGFADSLPASLTQFSILLCRFGRGW